MDNKEIEKLKTAIANGKFFAVYSALDLSYCDDVLSKLEPEELEKVIHSDLGKVPILGKGPELKCKALRGLEEQRCKKLLEKYFLVEEDNHYIAAIKANAIYQLLQQPALFESFNQNNRVIQRVNTAIYNVLKNYLGLNYLMEELEKGFSTVKEDDPSLGVLKSEIDKIIEFIIHPPKFAPKLKSEEIAS